MEKHYQSKVSSDRERKNHFTLPRSVAFSIDEATAHEIVRLSKLVIANHLHKVEKFDHRARYCERTYEECSLGGPEAATVEDRESFLDTEADCLNVTGTDFWFSAYVRHSFVEVRSKRKPIRDLQEFFGIVSAPKQPVDGVQAPQEAQSQAVAAKRAEADAFVQQVAALRIWRYDDNDGTPYEECRPPSDGFLDSHYCLMDLIEQARRLREGQ